MPPHSVSHLSADELAQSMSFARICKAVRPGPVRHTILRLNGLAFKEQVIIHGSFRRGYARIFSNDNSVVIAFRGTRESIDWLISNTLALRSPLRDCGPTASGVTVHYGFQRALDYPDKTTGMRSVEALLMHIQRLNLLDRPIFIVGHSLGGAIATLFAVKFRAAHPSVANRLLQKVVTFGAPAVGGNAFYDYYGDLHERTTRYVNRADAVPFTPPIGYRHVGREIWLSPNAVRTDMKWPERLRYALGLGAQSMGRDHFIASYIEGLERITIEPGRSRASL